MSPPASCLPSAGALWRLYFVSLSPLMFGVVLSVREVLLRDDPMVVVALGQPAPRFTLSKR